jgi:hypothetical protein
LRTVNCGNLATDQTSIGGDGSELGPCQELLFLSSNMVDGQLDGAVHMEQSRLASVFFGRRLPTNVDGWGGAIERGRFCEYTGAVRLDSLLKLSCSSCEGASALSACFMDDQPLLLGNACEVLRGELTPCADPQPKPVNR